MEGNAAARARPAVTPATVARVGRAPVETAPILHANAHLHVAVEQAAHALQAIASAKPHR